jgi:hypothetical protein
LRFDLFAHGDPPDALRLDRTSQKRRMNESRIWSGTQKVTEVSPGQIAQWGRGSSPTAKLGAPTDWLSVVRHDRRRRCGDNHPLRIAGDINGLRAHGRDQCRHDGGHYNRRSYPWRRMAAGEA